MPLILQLNESLIVDVVVVTTIARYMYYIKMRNNNDLVYMVQ